MLNNTFFFEENKKIKNDDETQQNYGGEYILWINTHCGGLCKCWKILYLQVLFQSSSSSTILL